MSGIKPRVVATVSLAADALHCKKNYEIPGFFLNKPSRDWDWVNYSRPGRVW